jgi:hypothetical protein
MAQNGDCQVANLVSHILEEREHVRPVLQFRLYPYMLQRRLDVEGHDVRRVKPPQAIEILCPDSFDDLVDVLPNLGLFYLMLRRHRHQPLHSVRNPGFNGSTTQPSGM